MAESKGGGKLVAENRRARFDYAIEDTLEAGIALVGSEVKALRKGNVNLTEAYASPESNGLFLINLHIPEYTEANRFNHEPRRPRRLLLHKKQIHKLVVATEREGMTIVPLKLYFNARGIAKVLIGLAKGKKLHDKRETEQKRDWQRQKARLLRGRE